MRDEKPPLQRFGSSNYGNVYPLLARNPPHAKCRGDDLRNHTGTRRMSQAKSDDFEMQRKLPCGVALLAYVVG
jgi:hypothetical protein